MKGPEAEEDEEKETQIPSAHSHACWELDPLPPGWGVHLNLPGELEAELSTASLRGPLASFLLHQRQGTVFRT